MVNVTELNRGPDISANAIDAEQLSVDDYNDGAIDHDQTGNRTHSGDDLSPNSIDAESVSADEELNAPVYATEADLPDASEAVEGSQAYVQSTDSFYVVVDE